MLPTSALSTRQRVTDNACRNIVLGRTRKLIGKRAVRADVQASDSLPLRIEAPKSIHDVDNGKLLGFGADLGEDHPGYHDQAYKDRRVWISGIAKQHTIGSPIPEVEYQPDELATWAAVLGRLRNLIPKYACQEYIEAFDAFNFSEDHIPQLQEVHEQLQAATGWSVRPVAGLMHPRDFLNGLAFKHFHSTQYIRHSSSPTYTPEPDVVHEILGHVPMLVNPAFCKMVEAIGRASLRASKEEIWHLTKVYWYTVEFGVVHQGSSMKAFGAGILSSFGELEAMGAGGATIEPLDPESKLPRMSYKDGYQKHYFSLESFQQGSAMLEEYSKQLQSSQI